MAQMQKPKEVHEKKQIKEVLQALKK